MRFIDHKTSQASKRACGVWGVGRAASATCQPGGTQAHSVCWCRKVQAECISRLTVFPWTLPGVWGQSASAVSPRRSTFSSVAAAVPPPLPPPLIPLPSLPPP